MHNPSSVLTLHPAHSSSFPSYNITLTSLDGVTSNGVNFVGSRLRWQHKEK